MRSANSSTTISPRRCNSPKTPISSRWIERPTLSLQQRGACGRIFLGGTGSMCRLLTPAFLMAVCLVQLFAPWPPQAAAEGALAVGITGDVAKDGYSIGIAYNIKTEEEARQGALDHCRKTGSPATKPKCAIVATRSEE